MQDLPRLKRSATVTRSDGAVVIRHHRDEITLEGVGAALFARLQPRADGATSIDALATAIAEKPARVRALLDQLEQATRKEWIEASQNESSSKGKVKDTDLISPGCKLTRSNPLSCLAGFCWAVPLS